MKNLYSTLIFLLSSLCLVAQTADDYFKPLKYRNIGPFRGGRSVSVSGVKGDPLTYYMGTTGGGLWQTKDAGQYWDNISDGYFKTGSVGAVAVSESHPYIIYVGMGEHAPRGVQSSYGDGVYKSTDGGKSWTRIGLEKTQHISRIQIHPTNPDVALVAAQGQLYGPSSERGIFKTTDGGQTWRKVLFVNDLTGASELSMDMNYPDIIYATMWEHQRKPNMVVSGGSGSGVYKSTDGGETWNKIEKGLPEELGKMAIAVSRANSSKVYALIESDSEKDLGGLFVSNDAGESWSRVSDDNRLTQRAWYYIEVFADPNDEHTVYVLSAPALRSIDGGKTWERITGTHGDYHDLWINPDNSTNMVIGNDGGAAISFSNGETWSTQSNMPTAQFYRINVDNLFPYNIYGGQQDNSTVKIPSLALDGYGITESDWTSSAGGESAFLAFDPDNPRYVMGGSYLGTIEIMDMEARAGTSIMAAPIQYLGRAARDMKYLYNWNAPIIWSQHEPGTFYHCAQLVLKTTDNGQSWVEASPDLTRNIDEKQGKGGGPYTNEAVGAENYGTISYIVESPHEKGVFWTGSDDGFVHVTRDNMQSWQNVTPKGLGETLVNAVEISPHDPATAYIATTKYKFNDHTPAIYKTTNYGKSWTNISEGIPYGAYTRVVREDQAKKDILYAGTELGIYLSKNGGKSWEPFQLNLPVTPIHDLRVHQNDLIVATSGRSFWILDDLHLVSSYDGGTEAKVYPVEDAILGNWGSQLNGNSASFDGTNPTAGVNPANGMVIYYQLPELSDSVEVKLHIKKDGKVVRSFSSKKDEDYKQYDGGPPPAPTVTDKQGLNRFVWNLRAPIMPGAENVYIEASFRGHILPPGKYDLEVDYGSGSVTGTGKIVKNPHYDLTDQDYQAYHEFMTVAEAEVTTMHNLVNQMYRIQKRLEELTKEIEDGELKSSAEELVKEIKSWDAEMVQRKSKAYDDVENFGNKFTAEYMFMLNHGESSLPKINEPTKARKNELDKQWNELKTRANDLLMKKLPALNKMLFDAGYGAIAVY